MRHVAAVLVFAVCTARAQSIVSGPSLGVVYDLGSQALRPILGIAGSSTLGPPLNLGFSVAAAVVSPRQDYAIAISADNSVKLVTFSSSGPAISTLQTSAAPDQVILSATGSAAIFYVSAGSTIQVVEGLPGSPSFGQPIAVAGLPQVPDVWAISDDGALVLAGVRQRSGDDGPRGAVFLIPEDGSSPRSIVATQHASAIAFLAGSHDVVISDDAANSVSRIQDPSGAAGRLWTFSDPNLPSPDSVQSSADGSSVLIGSSTGQQIAVVDANGSNPSFVACQCVPTEERPLAGASVYQLTEPANGLFWILDGNRAAPRVLFIPVPGAGSNAQHSPPQHSGSRGGR